MMRHVFSPHKIESHLFIGTEQNGKYMPAKFLDFQQINHCEMKNIDILKPNNLIVTIQYTFLTVIVFS